MAHHPFPSCLNPLTPMLLQPASQLTPRTIDWLWPGRLALGKLTLFDGDPDLGKSFLTLDLAARLSKARPFPENPIPLEPAATIILNAEDNPHDTILPRLLALDADMDRIFLWPSDDPDRWPALPSHVDRLDQALTHTAARLLIIDPVMAFLEPGVFANGDQSVRAALRPLAQLAEQHRCAVLLLRHLNKKPGAPSLYRGGGSIAFIAACRLAWLAARDPKNPARFILAQNKNNLAPPQTSLAYEFHPQPPGPPRLDWLGTSPWTAPDLLATSRRRQPHRAHARDFLQSFLRHRPRPYSEILQAARRQRLSHRTLVRAKDDLEITHQRQGFGKSQATFWLLPGQQLPHDLIPKESAPLNDWFKQMEEKFPPREPPVENP